MYITPNTRGHSTLRSRFLPKFRVDLDSGCWLWTGAVLKNGYGYLWPNKKAHRISWELHRGEIPAGRQVLHGCDVKICVNPNHLFIGTHKDNMRDMKEKGRAAKGSKIGSAKLTEDQVRQIRVSIEPSRALGKKFGVTHRTILLARKKQLWKSVS